MNLYKSNVERKKVTTRRDNSAESRGFANGNRKRRVARLVPTPERAEGEIVTRPVPPGELTQPLVCFSPGPECVSPSNVRVSMHLTRNSIALTRNATKERVSSCMQIVNSSSYGLAISNSQQHSNETSQVKLFGHFNA